MKKIIAYFIILVGIEASWAQRGGNIDSLQKVLRVAACDTCKIKILNQLAIAYGSNDPEKALNASQQAAQIAEKINNPVYLEGALRAIGVAYYFMGNYSTALEKLNASLVLSDKNKNTEGSARTLSWIGNTFYSLGNFEKCLDAQLRSLKLWESTGNKKGVGGALHGIANVYQSQANYKKALEYYFKALAIRKEVDELLSIAYTYNNIGLIYYEADSLERSLEYHLKCLQIVEKENDKKGIANSFGNLGEVYMKLGKYKDALAYLYKSLKISEEISDKNGISASYIDLGKTYHRSGDLSRALLCFNKAVDVAKEIDDTNELEDCYAQLAAVYFELRDYEKALLHLELHAAVKDTLINNESSKNLEEMQARFDTEKKEKEILLLQKDKNIRQLQLDRQSADIRRQKILIYSAIGGLLLVILLVFFIWKSYREKKKINIGLERKNIEINRQKNLIEEKNLLITDSIDYARNIQRAVLPADESVKEQVPGSFILFMPKDVVSGDFYWMNTANDGSVLIAAVDCTGHGVPGAFMSVMAYNMLENIVSEKKLMQPSLILDELNRSVIDALHQETENASVKYGMDIALVRIAKNRSEIDYAGAHNSLCIVRNGVLRETKANKTTIGMAPEKFSNHTLEVKPGDMLYFFTDGYADQKGGPDQRKFFSGEFRDLLAATSKHDPEQQKMILEKKFLDWKGDHEQIDDVLIIGVRI